MSQSVNYLPRFRFQAKPSHTTRLLVKRPDQYRLQFGIVWYLLEARVVKSEVGLFSPY